MNLKLSILLPVYNVELYLHECLDSILRQCLTLDNIEVIAVNDTSTDASQKILMSYEQKYSIFRYVNLKENIGLGAVRIELLNQAKGEYVWFFDSDDIMPDLALARVLAVIEKYNPQVILADLTYFKPEDKNFKIKYRKCFTGIENKLVKNIEHLALKNAIENCTNSVCVKIFQRKICINHNLNFEPVRKSEDAKFTYKFLSLVDNFYYLNASIYNYRLRGNSLSIDGRISFWSELYEAWADSAEYFYKKFQDKHLVYFLLLEKLANEFCFDVNKFIINGNLDDLDKEEFYMPFKNKFFEVLPIEIEELFDFLFENNNSLALNLKSCLNLY